MAGGFVKLPIKALEIHITGIEKGRNRFKCLAGHKSVGHEDVRNARIFGELCRIISIFKKWG
ncbi:conserved hypothetical protein [delta proteobacterium NaphS2]|nr:conserved hypothetical protein [delta proteobacterium NaphS2]